MPRIAIISASVRTGRKSHRVALFFRNYFTDNNLAEAEILDLKEFDFPVFDERLKYMPEPDEKVKLFAQKITSADAVLIVTPEYNGGYPASLKNVIDLLYEEWQRKPVAIATVSDGVFGGSQVITSLTFVLWKIKAKVVTAMFPVQKVSESYDENGVPADKEATEKRAGIFTAEILRSI